MTNHLPYWLAALYLENVGPRTFFHWLAQFPDIKSLFTASDAERKEKGFSENQRKLFQEINWELVERDLTWSQISHHHIISFDDECYPHLLKQISDPPLVLFVKGNKEVLSQKQIAMVGARRATPVGIKNAERFAYALAEGGYVITSGLALGIDAASHRGALSAHGITIGVAGTGLNHTYPSSHRTLIENIIQKNGSVISEFPLEVGPRAANFPRRNRIIGGLSLGVLVVEAALKSGSLITARHALEQDRDVFAIPGSIHNPLARGCHHLIRQGAKLIETAADIFEELGRVKPESEQIKQISTTAGLAIEQRKLLEIIDYEITAFDVILLRSGLTAGKVSPILLILELNGYIQSIPGGYIRADK